MPPPAAGPLDADFHIGLPESEDHRVAELVPPAQGLSRSFHSEIAERTGASTPLNGDEAYTRAWRAAELPAIGGIGNARSVARVHAMMACGVELSGNRMLSEATVAAAASAQISGIDLVSGVELTLGSGFGLNSGSTPISPNERAMFWAGWGGALAVIDLDARASVAYAMNRMAADSATDFRSGILAATALAGAST